ncbi:hypothetical protein A3A60_03225 [Candidatus Curtissbacteria bacterium RIFCSPLOWO2_01_FULL_42_26]|uniref:Uncharacterized protein n=1 Tax=Candidatus Curtissbacteria bacterium RIFCSPLOWO2_01_FULL_42_26 TaxID=1797729 RepID=A0A1F5I285_9BACT|nr:MAG: hypothetical protein A3A60_03225 [Candidatus Curtissbacteria bacterium RIFCSPLOWO2_01_FULL_42_26]
MAGEWFRPVQEHEANQDPLRQFAITQSINMLEAVGVEFPDGAVPSATREKTEVTLDLVKMIMDKDFIGPAQVEKATNRVITQAELTRLLEPLSIEMLARGKELGAFLTLRTGKAGDGSPLTAKWMQQKLEPGLKEDGKGRILYDTDWYGKENFFTKETPGYDLALAFTTKNVIDGSTGLNYLEQTQLLADFFKEAVFRGQKLPDVYQQAIDEFESKMGKLQQLLKDGNKWQQAAMKLSKLAINQLARRNFPEGIYDLALYTQSTGTWLLSNRWDWLNSRTADGFLVHFGRSAAAGASVYRWRPDRSSSSLGVCASWIVSKI